MLVLAIKAGVSGGGRKYDSPKKACVGGYLKALKKKKKQNKTVVSLATFVALQVWYGIPNERVPKSPLNSG